MNESNTKVAGNAPIAGVDVGKEHLDGALYPRGAKSWMGNTPEGHALLLAWLLARGVKRVGIEASGGFEMAVVAYLREHGMEVALLDPRQVKAFGVFKRRKAKNDKIDAALIAQCTAYIDTWRAPPDPRLAPFARHLLFIGQLEDDRSRYKTRRDSYRGKSGDARILGLVEAEIVAQKKQIREEIALLLKAVRVHPDLARRLALIASIEGMGVRTALTLVVLMPELGSLSREEVAALSGTAPMDGDPGKRSGRRQIEGGRTVVRTAVFCATVAACHQWNPALVAMRERLMARGKPHKVAVIACVRKMLIYVNAVLARGTPWTAEVPARRAG